MSRTTRQPRVVMWLENNGYPGDGRVRREAHALRDAGWAVTVVCPREGAPRREVVDGVAVRRYRRPEAAGGVLAYVLEYGAALVATLASTLPLRLSGRIDVIHAHNPPDFFAPLAWIFQRFGTAFVYDQHDLSPEMYRARFGDEGSEVLERILGWFERLSYRVADRVIATNDSYRAIAIERGGCEPGSVTVVRNGPELSIAYPREPLADISSRADLVLGYVGEIGPQDGVDHLVRAVSHLRATHALDVSCVIVGDGPARPGLQDLARDLGVSDAVDFTGWLSPDEVMGVLSSVDICVGPDPSNPYNDRSTMIKLTEYLAVGKPVVAYDLPEHRVTCGDAAWYATPADDPVSLAAKIAELWAAPEERERMGRVGLERARSELAWHRQVPALLSVYEDLADRVDTTS